MLIKSGFKDFYDFQAHIHGGGDPKITYVRQRLKPLVIIAGIPCDHKVLVEMKMKRNLRVIDTRYDANPQYECKYVAIAGRWFLLVKEGDQEEYTVLSKRNHPIAYANLIEKAKRSFWERNDELPTFDFYVGAEDPQLIELSRKINAPVFLIEGYTLERNTREYTLQIAGAVPTLEKMGIPSVYPAEQIYQDIAYFLGNKMKASPDLDPPVKVADKYRILGHGFDLKTSFRPKMKRADAQK